MKTYFPIFLIKNRRPTHKFYRIDFSFVFSSQDHEHELEDRAQSGPHVGNHHGRIPVVLVAVFSLVRPRRTIKIITVRTLFSINTTFGRPLELRNLVCYSFQNSCLTVTQIRSFLQNRTNKLKNLIQNTIIITTLTI